MTTFISHSWRRETEVPTGGWPQLPPLASPSRMYRTRPLCSSIAPTVPLSERASKRWDLFTAKPVAYAWDQLRVGCSALNCSNVIYSISFVCQSNILPRSRAYTNFTLVPCGVLCSSNALFVIVMTSSLATRTKCPSLLYYVSLSA